MNKKSKLIKLESIRIKNNLSYLDMAQKLNISKAYYWQIENGNRNLYYKMAKKIAEIFEMKPDELFYEDLK
ncbi:MAG: helix-turn-helix transcriptional regulator [Bacilli bacterium]|nr:helix-turn-helix transcriptional regulator [Bacilli bacterium]